MSELICGHLLYTFVTENNPVSMVRVLNLYNDFDINSPVRDGTPLLHTAIQHGRQEIVEYLLKLPQVNVTIKNYYGSTPLDLAINFRQIHCLKALLAHPNINADPSWSSPRTPFMLAVIANNEYAMSLLIASGKNMGDVAATLVDITLHSPGYPPTLLGLAQARENTNAANLIKRYIDDPLRLIHELQVDTNVKAARASALFAQVLFLCEGLLKVVSVGPLPRDHSLAKRFFGMATQLPMELQMLLCHRVYSSAKQNICTTELEPALRSLAWVHKKINFVGMASDRKK